MTQKAIYKLPVPKIMSFKVLKYFPSGKISYLLAYVNKISSWKNSCFFQKSSSTQQYAFSIRQMLVCGWNLLYLEINGIYN